jgi:hypothetical protein
VVCAGFLDKGLRASERETQNDTRNLPKGNEEFNEGVRVQPGWYGVPG